MILEEKMSHEPLELFNKGSEICAPKHSFGPFVRTHVLIHFIKEGCGTFHVNNQTFFVKKNQAFIIFPDVITYYEADAFDPWHYYWVGFKSTDVVWQLENIGIDVDHPILSFNDTRMLWQYITQLTDLSTRALSSYYKSTGLLHLIIDELFQELNGSTDFIALRESTQGDPYVDSACNYIAKNYTQNIRVDDITSYVDLERSYFSRLFKKYTGYSPQNYLIRYRMQQATYLLATTNIAIGTIGNSIGYENPYHFSKIFKKNIGVSPSEYRKHRRSITFNV